MAANILDRIILWTLEDELGDPEYFGKVDVGGALNLEALRFTFESHDIFEWPFDFWDVEDKQWIRKKLERLTGFAKEVHVIRVGAGEIDANKRPRLADGSFSVSTVQIPATVEE